MGNAKNKEESFTGRSAGNGEITTHTHASARYALCNGKAVLLLSIIERRIIGMAFEL